jgi:internalin A
MNKNSIALVIILSSMSILPMHAGLTQSERVKSFAQWCEEKNSVSAETRKTIDVLLKESGTDDCQAANLELNKLTSIVLYDGQISDLKPLASLTNLQAIAAAQNKIVDLRPLTALNKLRALMISSNQIVDVKPLASLNELRIVDLSLNQIVDVKPLAVLKELMYLDLSGNKIADRVCPVKPESICQF